MSPPMLICGKLLGADTSLDGAGVRLEFDTPDGPVQVQFPATAIQGVIETLLLTGRQAARIRWGAGEPKPGTD